MRDVQLSPQIVARKQHVADLWQAKGHGIIRPHCRAQDLPRIAVDTGRDVHAEDRLPAAVDGAAQIPAELKDVDAAEVKELADAVVANLALDNEKAALVVSKSLGVVIALADLALSLKK